ncbi:SCP2 sterol-binding domain-containing protein [Sulfitobacter geojensis]|jgi:putative sterol carrier protein|uniref:SCP2 sterol-binding domain-containing protein n=1 Tax=Sulfitobacter geojensis TaxID=1342299 RepID=A0AAE2VX04_9RHOB|nr:SCP2 sterol-binding domain-containing protein [Sulfitobacter geojensis]MBM1688732.1 SCP2 sterol-binding domain-containing protein [Sulfitobacter geojensis]MBM1692799.1 SCP2 sterol-binding domain-containing protein [Sulfitobacter geojensis]MBM1704965.1 SCP2 sterol-binding domain-containing protein [Sulfitobacter geojensis]MBM1709023.1 SCP2 sterol-binding domain-containing protein [Sulfitobacter geojensis]MBM1713088.1 SCP2 sterol-binding domain-containing protein [Sulfitobacter geojensis]
MSDIVNEAVTVLNGKLEGADFDGTAKFDIEGEGAVMIDGAGARAADEDADVTLSADADTFKEILAGETNPTSAFMTGKLKVDGDMGMAMKLASVLG